MCRGESQRQRAYVVRGVLIIMVVVLLLLLLLFFIYFYHHIIRHRIDEDGSSSLGIGRLR